MTGCLHEDGLADVADSMGGWTADQRLTILRDSRIGSYGATVLGLSLAARGVLLATLPLEHFTAYVVSSHVLCRWSTLPLSYYLPSARETEGQGARVARLTSTTDLILGSLFTFAVIGAFLRKAAIAPIGSALVLTFLSALFYLRKYNGVTGDCFGATNQLTEIAVYVCGVWKA
jgi:adenosylcobinamide-GDP ribazoletransferase